MNLPLHVFCATVLSVVSSASAFATPVVFQQSPMPSNGVFSSNGSGVSIADNFLIPRGAAIDSLSWTGFHFGNAPAGFDISLYDNVEDTQLGGERPGNLIYLLSVNPQSTLEYFPDGAGSYAVDDLYSTSLFFTALPGTQYWLTIAAHSTSNSIWVWNTSADGDGRSVTTENGSFFSFTTDENFSFTGTLGPDTRPVDPTSPTVTPEPSSLALLGTGLLGAVGMVRRRFKA